MRASFAIVFFAVCAAAQPTVSNHDRSGVIDQIIDQAVNPSQLPAGYGAFGAGYMDQFGTVYRFYGQATVDGAVPLNEKTVFAIGSLTKVFVATLLGIANTKGLALSTPALNLLPPSISIAPADNRYGTRLLDMADHHAGLPKNEGHLFSVVNDLYTDYAADPITCNPATDELIHDCGCCDPLYMSLLGLQPTCGNGGANPVYTCPTHAPTKGLQGWVYSNLGFEVLGNAVANWLNYPDWNQANLQEIAQPLGMPDTMPLESFTQSQISRAAKHCDPATRTTNVNCQLLDWLPVGNPAGGLFSTLKDLMIFAAYNSGLAAPPTETLANALPIVHQQYELAPGGGQELAWQTLNLVTGELDRWKDGANGPFRTWIAYTTGPLARAVVLWTSASNLPVDLGAMSTQILTATGPSISSVTTANGPANIAQNTWIVIKGTNLVPANAPAAGLDWSSAPSFAKGQLPTEIGSVSVTVNGKPAFVYFYCSAVTSTVCASDQINVLTPLDSTTGPVEVVVNNQDVLSAPFTVNMGVIEPAFLLFSPAGYVAATHADGSLLGPTSLYPGYSTPARPGETIVTYAVGFGLPLNGLTNGSSTQLGVLSPAPTCQIGGQPAAVAFAGLVSPGLYQFNLTVPSGLAAGNQAVQCNYNGATTPAGDVIAVQP